MSQRALSKAAAGLFWLQLPALEYILYREDHRCVNLLCLVIRDPRLWWMTEVLVLAAPLFVGVLLWRSSLLASGTALVLAVAEIKIGLDYALVQLPYGGLWPLAAFFVCAVAAAALVLTAAALLFRSSWPDSMPRLLS